MATGHSIAQHSLRGGGGPGTPPAAEEARARPLFTWFALIARGSTGFHEEGASLGKSVQMHHPLPPQASPGRGWNDKQGISIQMWRRGRLGATGSKAAHAGEAGGQWAGYSREMSTRTGRGGHVRPRTWEGLGVARSQDKRPLEGQGIITGP